MFKPLTNHPIQGIAVDHERDLLFAAGQDCRLRGWSLRTSFPLSPPRAPDPPDPQLYFNPFLASFSHPITSLQVTEEPGEAGVSLWATADRDLYQFHLGQR
jgi:DDB1- and CUL4-associated factor 4